MDLSLIQHKLQAITLQELQTVLQPLLQDPTLTLEAVKPLFSVWRQWITQLYAVSVSDISKNHSASRLTGDEVIMGSQPEESQIVLIFLSKAIEEAVDTAWQQSPFDGLMHDVAAKALLMRAVALLLPQTAGSCAPLPVLSAMQRRMFLQKGLLQQVKDLPVRRYAVLTYFPYQGGCHVCALQQECGRSNFFCTV